MQNTQFGRRVNVKERFNRHKFDKEIIKKVGKYLDGNNYDGIIEAVEDWSVIVASVGITMYLYPISTIFGIISYIITLFVIGGRQRALADILHQASHGSAANNPVLNWVLGTFFSGYTVFQSFSIYTASHVKLHHPWLGNAYRDPDYIGYIENKICGVNRSRNNTKKYIFSIISPVTSYNYLKYLIKNRIFDKNENKFETIVRFIYWVSILYLIISNNCFLYFILFWIIPLISTNVWVGSLLELLEHFPMIDDNSIPFIDILITKNRIWSSPVNFILGAHHEGYHLVHHLFPKLPSWHFVAVHHILMKDDVYSSLDHGQVGCVNMIKQVIENSGNFKLEEASRVDNIFTRYLESMIASFCNILEGFY